MAWTKEQGERALAEIRRRSSDDPEFRKLCLTAPAEAVREVAGMDLPPGFKLSFKEDAHGGLTVVLPGARDLDLRDAELDRIVGGASTLGSCFAAGTPVLMADGSVKPIQTIRAGDHVMAGDERTGSLGPRTVTALLVHGREPLRRAVVEEIADGIYLTPNHPFFSGDAWVQIGKLPIGADLVHVNDKSRRFSRPRLAALEQTDRIETVYNLEVAVDHTYFVHGLLVHNGSVVKGVGGVVK